MKNFWHICVLILVMLTAIVPSCKKSPHEKITPATDPVINKKTIFLKPVIDSIKPNSGKHGDIVSFYGKHINPVKDSIFITFWGNGKHIPVLTKNITYADSNLIKLKVPDSCVTGLVEYMIKPYMSTLEDVTTFTLLTDSVIIVPIIDSIKPTSGYIGDTIVISGKNFGSDFTVFFKDTLLAVPQINIISATLSKIILKVPANAASGFITVKNKILNKSTKSPSQFILKVKDETPKILEILPSHGKVGEEITIKGNNFGLLPANNNVYFHDNIQVPVSDIIKASATELVVRVPLNAATGKIKVENTITKLFGESIIDFTVDKPATPIAITTIVPNKGQVGDEILINGSNFTNAQDLEITFDGSPSVIATATTVTPNQIKLNVPANAASGKITIKSKINLSTATSAQIFTVITPQQDVDIHLIGYQTFKSNQAAPPMYWISQESARKFDNYCSEPSVSNVYVALSNGKTYFAYNDNVNKAKYLVDNVKVQFSFSYPVNGITVTQSNQVYTITNTDEGENKKSIEYISETSDKTIIAQNMFDGKARAIKNYNNSIYIAGYVMNTNKDTMTACYWQNSKQTKLSRTIGNTIFKETKAYDITVIGNDTYVVGSGVLDNKTLPLLWINNNLQLLTASDVKGEALCIYTEGGNYYAGGYDGNYAVYWENGNVYKLSDGSKDACINAIFVKNGTIYSAGHDYKVNVKTAKYWINSDPTGFWVGDGKLPSSCEKMVVQ